MIPVNASPSVSRVTNRDHIARAANLGLQPTAASEMLRTAAAEAGRQIRLPRTSESAWQCHGESHQY